MSIPKVVSHSITSIIAIETLVMTIRYISDLVKPFHDVIGGGGQGGGKFSGSASLRGHSDWVDSLGGSKNMTMGGTGGGPAK